MPYQHTTPRKPGPLTLRHVKLPIDVLNDKRLNGEDVRAFAVMWDCSRDGLCTISERRLGERLFKSEQAARRIIRRLQACGWIAPIDHGNGLCRDYQLLTPIIHNRGMGAPKQRHASPEPSGSRPSQDTISEDMPLEEQRANRKRLAEMGRSIVAKTVSRAS